MIIYDADFKNIILFAAPGKTQEDNSSMKFTHRLAKNISKKYSKVYYFNVVTTRSIFLFIKQILALRKILKNLNPNLVVSHWGGFTGLTVLLATYGYKKIITFHGPDLNWDLSRSTIGNLLVILISKITSVFYNSAISVSNQLNECHFNRVSYVIPMPIDVDHFRPKNKKEIRNLLGFGQLDNIVVFICGNDPIGKGLELATKVQEISVKSNQYNLLIFDKMIRYEDMPDYIAMADCLIFLSYKEGSPNIVREACACNVPVVSVNVGDVSEVLCNFDACSVVDRDPEIINRAILRAINHTNLNMRDEILELNTFYLEKIISVYKNLIEA